MFRHTIPIGRVLGIPVDLDYSWFLIAVLTTWVLAVSYYPAEFKGGTSAEYWLMDAACDSIFNISAIPLGTSRATRKGDLQVGTGFGEP